MTRPRCREWLDLHGEAQQHPPALPGITASQLRPGFIINQGQGSQHRRQSCSARRQADGPSLASWPSALPGGGGAQGQAPPLADAEGRASAQKSRARSQSCFGTGDTEDPSLSSKHMGHVLDPGSPCPPHHIRNTLGLREAIHSLIPSSTQPTDWVPGGTGWQGPAHSHEHKREALPSGALHRPQTPSPHLRWTDTQTDKAGPHGASLLQLNTSLSLYFFFCPFFSIKKIRTHSHTQRGAGFQKQEVGWDMASLLRSRPQGWPPKGSPPSHKHPVSVPLESKEAVGYGRGSVLLPLASR